MLNSYPAKLWHVLSALLMLLFGVAVTSAETPNTILAKALAFDKDGFLEDSALEWEKLSQAQPEGKLHILADLKRSSAYFKLGRFDDAIQVARKLTQEEPKNFNAFFHLANALSGVRNFPEAVTAFDKAVQLRPDEGLAQVGLALAHFGNGNSAKAMEHLQESKTIFKGKKNIVWHQNVRIMIPQIKDFARYPPNFADLWLENSLKLIRDTYEQTSFDPENP